MGTGNRAIIGTLRYIEASDDPFGSSLMKETSKRGFPQRVEIFRARLKGENSA
jgi:hypothetical protein